MIPAIRNISKRHGEGDIMWNKSMGKRRLSYEILGLFFVCLAVTVALYCFLAFFGVAVIQNYCWEQDILLDEDQLYHLDVVVFSASLVVSVIFFIVLFLVLFGERISYIGTIIKGIDILRQGDQAHRLPIEGNNELTRLAEEINRLSETAQAIKEKERCLQEEREELIRTLSHDIRTPLTSLISYTELYSAKTTYSQEELAEYFSLVRKKSGQIRDLTDILLDGGKRDVIDLEDARLLMTQLVGEFEEALEETFSLSVDLSGCPAFSGAFDVGEMRRLFDNLISNVQKYADPQQTVMLNVMKTEQGLVIRQKNMVRRLPKQTESYRMGLHSIRRIAQNYGGSITIHQDDTEFEIVITLSAF